MNQTVIDFYSETADHFNRKYKTSSTFIERYEVWTTLFKKYTKPTDSVLDVGCGSGIFSKHLAQMGLNVLGIDGSPTMINLCLEANNPPISNLTYQLQALPFDNSFIKSPQFDVIIASSVLEYIEHDTLVLSQMSALLKQEGFIIVSFPNRNSIFRSIEKIIFKLFRKPAYFKFVKRLYDEKIIAQKLSSLGFMPVEIVYYPTQNIIFKTLNLILPKKFIATLFVGVYCRK